MQGSGISRVEGDSNCFLKTGLVVEAFAMRWLPGWSNPYNAERRRMIEGLHSSGEELDRKFWVAMAIYAVLALLVWFTMDAGKVLVMGKPVELRLIPLIIIGGLVLRTVLARSADRIRRGGEKNSS
jgi:hypothetical protein